MYLIEPSSPTISTEASFVDGSNKEALNVYNVLSAIIEIKWDINYVEILSAKPDRGCYKKYWRSLSLMQSM